MKAKQSILLLATAFTLSLCAMSCKKTDNTAPQGPGTTHTGPATPTGNHYVNPALAGTWMWTEAGNSSYYDDNGVYNGDAYGLALQYNIHADGTGTCYNHLYSSIGEGTGFEVNIASAGFFETDDQGHLGYFPVSGTYKTSDGVNRALRPDELWDVQAKKGASTLYQKLVITNQGGRDCFQVTSSDGITDTYFKVK